MVRRNRNLRRQRAGRVGRGGLMDSSSMSMLTGNTGDVKPQLLSFRVTESANDTTTSVSQALPVLRNFAPGGQNRAQLIEVLKVWFAWPDSVTGASNTRTCLLSTKSKGTTAGTIADPDVFAFAARNLVWSTSVGFNTDGSRIDCIDLTDGDGNGILVATDTINAQVFSTTTGSAQSVGIKLLYRIAGASVIEYVGIVQGQQ